MSKIITTDLTPPAFYTGHFLLYFNKKVFYEQGKTVIPNVSLCPKEVRHTNNINTLVIPFHSVPSLGATQYYLSEDYVSFIKALPQDVPNARARKALRRIIEGASPFSDRFISYTTEGSSGYLIPVDLVPLFISNILLRTDMFLEGAKMLARDVFLDFVVANFIHTGNENLNLLIHSLPDSPINDFYGAR